MRVSRNSHIRSSRTDLIHFFLHFANNKCTDYSVLPLLNMSIIYYNIYTIMQLLGIYIIFLTKAVEEIINGNLISSS